MMMSPAFAPTMAYDPAGNPIQMTYPAGTALYPAQPAFPIATSDPRYELIPHRIFVGGFPATTTELDLRMFFEKFGHVREAKVIRSSEGTSKGYGFITFDTEDEAKAVMQLSVNQDAEKLEFRGRRLNLGPAIRRMIHGPRYPTEYAIATPAGQLLTTSAFGAFTYAYPQSQLVMLPPNQIQPFIFSAAPAVTPAQYTFSNTQDSTNNRAQQIAPSGGAPVMLMPNTGNTISPHDSPRTNGIGGQPQAVNTPTHVPAGQPQQQQQQQTYSITAPGLQQIAQMTPSVAAQRTPVFPQAAYYAPAAPPDMTHYSQMTAPTYFFAQNGYQTIDTTGQAATAIALPAPNPVAQLVPQPITPQTPQQCYYEENMIPGWQNPTEVRPTGTPRRSPMKSVVSLSSQLPQVNLQQYDRKECQQGNTVNATATNKQFT